MPMTRSGFASQCVRQGLFFAVSPHYLMTAAQVRSKVQDDAVDAASGPFRVTQAMWDADSQASDLDVILDPEDMGKWFRQCIYAANATRRHLNGLIEQLGRFPTVLELYREQWPADDPPLSDAALTAALDAALAATAPDIASALADEIGPDVPPPPGPATSTAPAATAQTSVKVPVPNDATHLFRIIAPRVMGRLIDDFRLSDVQAAGILGNIGEECGGFSLMQEIRPANGPGGFGWCQWTGTRRDAFFALCAEQGLSPTSEVANYAYLRLELSNAFASSIDALRKQPSLPLAVASFKTTFERPLAATARDDVRNRWGQLALDTFQAQQQQVPPGMRLPAAIGPLLDPDFTYEIVGKQSAGGADYWLLDEIAEGGGQVLVKQPTTGDPEVLARDTVVFPLSPSVAVLPQIAALPPAVKAGFSAGVAPVSPAGPPPVASPGQTGHAALVLKAAKRCNETLVTRTVKGTKNGHLACAYAVNEVVRQALGHPVGGGLSTVEMGHVLARSHTQVPEAAITGGMIVISPTGQRVGHVGIVGDVPADPALRGSTVIYSNSSERGIFARRFTLARWKAFYAGHQKLPVLFYEV